MKKVLIVEDDPTLAAALEQRMIASGYQAVLVRDGGAALHMPLSEKPDLILLGILLPTMSGYELMETWRQNPVIATVPIIAMSHSDQEADAARIAALGACTFVPNAQLNPEQVVARIGECLKTPAPPEKKPRLEGMRIVWTEDDLFLRDLMAAKLSQEGAIASYAKDGEECLAILGKPETGRPDIIMLDIILPGMSGFDVLTRIRENPALKGVPVIVLSNLGQQEDIEKTRWLGACRHLVKADTDPDDIVENIVAVLHENGAASVPPAPSPLQ